MAQPGRTAQGNRLGPKFLNLPSTGAIHPKLRRFFVVGVAVLAGVAGACSSGESGLVLGNPQPQIQAGSGGAGSAAVGAEGGTGETLVLGGEPAVGGSAGEASDPGWIQQVCTPTLSFENRDTTAQGQLFTDAVPDPSEPVWAASHAACRLLYRSASEVKPVAKLSLIVEDYDGIASTQGTTLHLSTRYLKTIADRGVDLRLEITGILHFGTSLVFQSSGSDADSAPPHWLIVGIADYVRLESGYIDRGERAKGGSYDGSGSQTTAFFLDYLVTKNPTFVMQVNQRLAPTSPVWSNDVFTTLLGSDVDALWTSYQATL
jgi:hypothetical protein